MNRIVMVLGCISVITLFSLTGIAENQHINNGMYTTVSSNSMLFSLGKIDASGTFYGMQNDELAASFQEFTNNPIVSSYINADLIENLHIFPLVGSSTIADISNISIIPQEAIDTENIMDILDEIEFFSDVSISLSNGLFLIGTSDTSIQYDFNNNLCFSGFISFPFGEFESVNSFFCLSEQESTASYNYNDEYILIYPFSEESEIRIHSSTGNEIWTNHQSQSILFLENNDFQIMEHSSIHILPLDSSSKDSTLQYILTPSEKTPNIMEMIQHVDELGEDFDMSSIPFISENDQGMQLITSLSSMLNGGIIFVNHSKNVEIDGASHSFENFGFTRVDQATITSSPLGVSVDADYALVFLGDHFYSSQAATSENGVGLPIFPILFWIGAIISLILFQFFLKKRDKKYVINDKRIHYISIIIHILGFIIAFLLLNTAVQHQFGISFFQELSINGFTMVAGILLLIQCVLWVLGFLFAALPIGIIVSKMLSFFGFDKNYRHFSKGATALLIWPIAAIYLTMLFNIVLLFFNPFNAMI